LHVGHKKGKGSDDIKVRLFNRKTNLHAVWDDGIINTRGMEWPRAAWRTRTSPHQGAQHRDRCAVCFRDD
jgi:hypothetical protein